MDKIIGVSMFSSGGVAEVYLKNLGIDIVVANELAEDRAKFYSHLYPSTNMVVGDIMQDDVYSHFIKLAKKYKPKFLLATPPCQGMSSLGKKDYEDDERNYLITAVIDTISVIDFDYILIENVPKFFELLFPFKRKRLKIVEILQKQFGERYHIDFAIVNAKDFGVPQSRPRAILKLFKKDILWPWPNQEREITLREAIGHLPSLYPGEKSAIKWHYASSHSEMQIEAMSHTPEGKSAMVNEVYYPKKKNGEKVSGFHNTYKRMKWNSPAPARATNNGLISGHNNVHPGKLMPNGLWSDPRVLTMLELFIVSSLPEKWSIPSWAKDSFVRQLIGEAIPPLMLKKIIEPLIISHHEKSPSKSKVHKKQVDFNEVY